MIVQPLNQAETKKAEAGKPFKARCMYFAGCRNEAVDTLTLPFGEVPVCQACLTFYHKD